MHDRMKFKEDISFVLNGQPIIPGEPPKRPVTLADVIEEELRRDDLRNPPETD